MFVFLCLSVRAPNNATETENLSTTSNTAYIACQYPLQQ